MADYLVVTGYDDRMSAVGDLFVETHRHYAQCHQYDFECIRKFDSGTHPSWQKLGNVLSRVRKYKALLWLDADTIVTNATFPFEILLHEYTGMIFSRGWSDDMSGKMRFSAGNFIACNCPGTIAILEEAMKQKKWENQPLWDNSALMDVYDSGFMRHSFVVLPGCMLNAVPIEAQNKTLSPWRQGYFLCHLTGISNDSRIRMFNKFLRLSISTTGTLPVKDERTT